MRTDILNIDLTAPKTMSKTVMGETLVKMGAQDERIVVCEADLMRASGTAVFEKAYPERHFNFGIAEQNMVCAAAGLAISGKIVYASTFANFASKRACDQMSVGAAYNKANVRLCGIYAGLTSEKNGGTHIAVEDIAIMRSIPGVVVLTPGDLEELRQVIIASADMEGTLYIRIPKLYKASIFSEKYQFQVGKATTVKEGNAIALCACGLMSGIALQAAQELEAKGIAAKVINFGTVKPIDREAVLEAAATGAVLTIENHSVIGGLGSAILEVLCESRQNPAVRKLGLQDVFGQTASLEWQLEHNGILKGKIVQAAMELLAKE